jgi:hypothetical protein
MVKECPIDVNFSIAVSPPVPAVIYSCSIELAVAITKQPCLTSFIFSQFSLTAFAVSGRRGSCYVIMHKLEYLRGVLI